MKKQLELLAALVLLAIIMLGIMLAVQMCRPGLLPEREIQYDSINLQSTYAPEDSLSIKAGEGDGCEQSDHDASRIADKKRGRKKSHSVKSTKKSSEAGGTRSHKAEKLN